MAPPDRLRTAAIGLLAGFLLSVARAPLGVDLVGIPAALPGDTFLFRGLALLVVAVGVGRVGTRRVALVSLLFGGTLGFGLHGLLIGERFAPAGRGGLYVVCLAALAVLAFAGGRREPSPDEGEEREPTPSLVERAALLLVGVGLALALEAVARPLRLLGGGLAADDALFGTLFLALTTLGAAAFGPLIPRALGGAGSAALLVAAAAVALTSLEPLARFSDQDGFGAFLRSPPWNLDNSHAGRHAGDLLVGARVLVLPAFVLGMALAASPRRTRVAWTLFGAAAGTLVMPALLALEVDGVEPSAAAAVPALRVLKGILLAGVGGLVAALTARGSAPLVRGGAALAALAAVLLALFAERPEVLPLSPWERHRVYCELAVDSTEGLLTVERTLDMGHVVTLDRQRLSPSPEEESADEQRMRISWARSVEPLREGDERRVLLIGQLTPARARVLRGLGATHVDRTGAWHAHMEPLEAFLFGEDERPPGRILAPGELAELAPWSLVVVPPIEGRAPQVAPPDVELGPAVVWVSPRTTASEGDWGGLLRLSSSGLEDLALAVHQNDGIPSGEPSPATTPWSRLSRRRFERAAQNQSVSLRRLADGSRGGEHEHLTEGLARHFAAQVRSSPFEEYAQSIEIDPEALTHLREAALQSEPDPFLRGFWNGLAQVLADKRELELVFENLEPLAAAWEPWWQLELALARADLESLDPASAAERLLIVVAARPLDIRMRILCADALSMAQRPADAVVHLREADRLQPGRRDVRRRLAMALARAGHPDAAALVAELVDEDPLDDELRAFAGPGPYPPVEVQYQPVGMDAHEHD